MTSVYEDPTSWRLQTGGAGVPYRIVSMSGEFDPENAGVQMEALVPANKLVQFATEMFPQVIETAESALGLSPPIYPSYGKIYGTNMYAQKVSWRGHVDGKPVDPFGIDPGAPADTYQKVCQVTIDFRTMNDQEQSDPSNPETFLEVSCTGGGRFQSMGATAAKWMKDENTALTLDPAGESTDAVGPDTPISMVVPTTDWDLSWPRVPYTYWTNFLIAKIRAALGRVNSAAMPIFANAPRGTILFSGYSLKKNYSWRSGVSYQSPFNLNLKFQELRVVDAGGTVRGHNDMWRPGYGWRFLKHKDGSPLYSYHNLSAIF